MTPCQICSGRRYNSNEKVCKPVQPAEVGAKASPCMVLLGKVLDIQVVDKLSELVAIGLPIHTPLGRNN